MYNEAAVLFRDMPDLSQYRRPADAAKAAYKFVRKLSEEAGQNPDIETAIYKPGEREESSGSWWVVWESGPYDWAVTVTCDGRDRTYSREWYCETYWGFDLIFQKT